MAFLVTYYYPFFMALVFIAFLLPANVPAKGRFFLWIAVVLLIAVFFAHFNRIFDLWPAHRYFASGHMTFSFAVALALGMLRPWTLAITLPLLVPFGIALVALKFHTVFDVLGAIPLVLGVYAIVHRFWPLPLASPSLDRSRNSL